MNINKKLGIAVVIGLLSIAILYCQLHSDTEELFDKFKETREYYQSYEGKSVLINGDTLLIINSHYISGEFTLSNGNVYGSNLIFNNLIDTNATNIRKD